MKIEPISNSKMTLLRKLNQKKYRQREQLFLIEGARAVKQILKNGSVKVEALFFDEAQGYWQRAPWSEYGTAYHSSLVEEGTFAEVSDTDNPQGVIALCTMPAEVEPEKLAASDGVILATDAVQDPGNLGTMVRTAAWFGVHGLISGQGTVDLFHPKVVRSTAGAIGTIPFINGDLSAVLPILESNGWQVVLLDAGTGSVPLQQIERTGKTLVVVGNEAHGIDSKLIADHRKRARIVSPRGGDNVESLNAAIATSIALYVLS